MCVYKTRVRNFALMVLASLLLAASASAQTKISTDLAKIRIKNFGRTDLHYYRGAQPNKRDYTDLAGFGIKTVIDLTRDGRTDEPGLVQRAGMKFYRIPLTTSDRPSDAAVAQFLKLVNDPANWPVYVHCQGGRHRTGIMTAVYRITQDGWTPDRAYDEMRQYKFEGGFISHTALKNFVYDYYGHLGQTRAVRTAERSVAAGVGAR